MTLRRAIAMLSDPASDWREWSEALDRLHERAYVEPPYTRERLFAALRAARPVLREEVAQP